MGKWEKKNKKFPTLTLSPDFSLKIPTTLKHDIKFLTAQRRKSNREQPRVLFKAAVAAICIFGNHQRLRNLASPRLRKTDHFGDSEPSRETSTAGRDILTAETLSNLHEKTGDHSFRLQAIAGSQVFPNYFHRQNVEKIISAYFVMPAVNRYQTF